MNKRLQILCACFMAIGAGGCSQDVAQLDEGLAEDLSTDTHALFDEEGGEPWGVAEDWEPNLHDASQQFGRKVVKGKFYYGVRDDVVANYDAWFGDMHQIEYRVNRQPPQVGFGEKNTLSRNNNGSDSASFGRDIVAGDYCHNLNVNASEREGDLLLVSIPTESYGKKSYCGGVVMYGMVPRTPKPGKSFKPLLTLYGSEKQLAGQVMAVGDVNGDGQPDLVYLSTPLADTGEYKPARIGVHLNMCKGTDCSGTSCSLREDVGVSNAFHDPEHGGDKGFGEKIYVQDLNGDGRSEIIVVMNGYNPDNLTTPPGAVFFYKYEEGAKSLVESRDPIVGEGKLSTLAFMDIDGDGYLDILAGEPMYDYRETGGRIRAFMNPGQKGKAFKPKGDWERLAGKKYASFGGGDIVVDDLNGDDVPDLVVGAPGENGRCVARIYVFVGTKDGTIFSEKPYWTYKYASGEPGSSTRANNALGTSIVTVDADNSSGWKDIVATAPNTTLNGVTESGNIRIIKSGTSPCYRADRCLFSSIKDGKASETCYEAGDVNPENACAYCDPSKNNFGWSAVTCDDEENACREAPRCDETLGCVSDPLPDGTSCGETSCSSATLVSLVCKAGACVEDVEDCGDYVCASLSGENACLTSCTTSSQCVNPQAVCKAGTCVINTPPVIIETVLEPTPARVKPGESLKAFVMAHDDDGDALTYRWSDNGSGAGTFSDGTSEKTLYTVHDSTVPGMYSLQVTVCDEDTCVSSDRDAYAFEVYVDPVNHAPTVELMPESVLGRRGETFELSALGSDPDGDPMTYVWKVDASYGTLTDSTSPTTSFTIGNAVDDDTVFYVSVLVSDGKATTEGRVKVTVLADTALPSPVFVKPEDGATVPHTFEVVGAVASEGEREDDRVFLYNENGLLLCASDVVEGRWSCNVTIDDVGKLMLRATYQAGDKTSSPTSLSIFVDETSLPVPVITSPEAGEMTPSTFVVEGRVDATEGEVYVWDVVNEAQRSLVCVANTQPDGTWRCVSNTEQVYGEHSISAYWKNGEDVSDWSALVTFTVDPTDTSLSIVSMKDGDVVDTYRGLVISGTATSGDLVTVQITPSEADSVPEGFPIFCEAFVDSTGRWYCNISGNVSSDESGLLRDGGYVAFASTTHNWYETTVSVDFVVQNQVPDGEVAHSAKGGSCQMTMRPSVHAPWWIAACLGLLLGLRRRREA